MNHKDLQPLLPREAMMNVPDIGIPLLRAGKVRDLFDLDDALLIVATDRISAFDVILPNGIPGKGIILTQISRHWFNETKDLVPNHLIAHEPKRLREVFGDREDLIARSMIVRKLSPLPVEAVVRGYISGSAWRDYLLYGSVFGQEVPAGLRESEKLPAPLFTPTTKATSGHDQPLSLAECQSILGESVFESVRDLSLRLFALGSAYARQANLLLADTKFEFAVDEDGRVILVDEVLTPDSSRYWPFDSYEPGQPQYAFDKQFVRDYLETLDWDKTPPGPELPKPIVERTKERYLAAAQKLING